jgi:hypothetical protein
MLSHTANMYFINEAILTSAQMDLDLFIVCALDEEEFGYVDLTCEFIEEYYKVKPMSAKNYLAGKDMKGKVDGLGNRSKLYKEKLGRKLKDSYLDVEMLFDTLIYEKDKKRLRKRQK